MKQKTDTPKGTEFRNITMLDLLYSKFQKMTARVKANGSFTVLLGMEARAVTQSKKQVN